jgi:SAM-dependent methyltransferase
MTENLPTCRICKLPFHEYTMGEKNGFKLVACKSCGSVLAEPWPPQEELDRFFGDIQPEIVHLPDPQGEISRIKKLLGKITPGFAGKRFLDISCRQGYAVVAAKELGFQAMGIDPHKFFIDFAKDKYDSHLFEHATAMDYAARGGQAEVVFSIESFCEQTDPEGAMAALSKILAPGGTLYLQEPDGNNFSLPKNFARWDFVDPPLNFVYISKKGMEILLARHGLKIKQSLFTWGPFMRLIVVRKGG